jgi:hypothetical protein
LGVARLDEDKMRRRAMVWGLRWSNPTARVSRLHCRRIGGRGHRARLGEARGSGACAEGGGRASLPLVGGELGAGLVGARRWRVSRQRRLARRAESGGGITVTPPLDPCSRGRKGAIGGGLGTVGGEGYARHVGGREGNARVAIGGGTVIPGWTPSLCP